MDAGEWLINEDYTTLRQAIIESDRQAVGQLVLWRLNKSKALKMKGAATAMIPVIAFAAVILVLLCHPPMTSAQDGIILVSRHTLPIELRSVNGSSEIGDCESDSGNLCIVDSVLGPSDLTDGVTPPVGCFEGDWAGGFFTLQRTMDDTEIGFDFGQGVSVARIELVLLNSPLLRIGVSDVGVFTSSLFPDFTNSPVNAVGSATVPESEDALLTVNINIETPQSEQFYFIQFMFNADSDWVFIGEVTFFDSTNPASTASPVSTSTIMCSTRLSPSTTTPTNMFATSSSPMQLTPAIPSIETTTTTTTTAMLTTTSIITTMAVTAATLTPPESNGVIIGTTVGVLFGILATTVIFIVVIIIILRGRKKQPPQSEHVYDEVDLPELLSRISTEVATEPNIAYAGNIQIQVEPNAAYSGIISADTA